MTNSKCLFVLLALGGLAALIALAALAAQHAFDELFDDLELDFADVYL